MKTLAVLILFAGVCAASAYEFEEMLMDFNDEEVSVQR